MEPIQPLTLADFLRGAGTQARGFAAGAVNPFGLTGLAAHGLGYPSIRETLNQWDADAPLASVLGTALIPGSGFARAIGFTAREIPAVLPHLTGFSLATRNLYDVLSGESDLREERRRANEYGQAGY